MTYQRYAQWHKGISTGFLHYWADCQSGLKTQQDLIEFHSAHYKQWAYLVTVLRP